MLQKEEDEGPSLGHLTQLYQELLGRDPTYSSTVTRSLPHE
jgi:hypothetical protein